MLEILLMVCIFQYVQDKVNRSECGVVGARVGARREGAGRARGGALGRVPRAHSLAARVRRRGRGRRQVYAHCSL